MEFESWRQPGSVVLDSILLHRVDVSGGMPQRWCISVLTTLIFRHAQQSRCRAAAISYAEEEGMLCLPYIRTHVGDLLAASTHWWWRCFPPALSALDDSSCVAVVMASVKAECRRIVAWELCCRMLCIAED